MLLVGSHALKQYSCMGGRQPKDVDYICTHDDAKSFAREQGFDRVIPNKTGTTLMCFVEGWEPVELMIAWPGSSNEAILNRSIDREVASLNTLYLLKISHRFLKNSPHFLKTRDDILEMRAHGATIEWPDILKLREKETYTYKHPDLTRSKVGFFDPREVRYQWDHDSIHRCMAIDPLVPAYSKYQPAERKGVMTSRALFEALPLEIRLQGVLEEAYVLALERSQIPFRGKVTPARSFQMALQKVCTSITSGWFREFAWEAYDQVMGIYDPGYVERFDAGVTSGIVMPFQGGN